MPREIWLIYPPHENDVRPLLNTFLSVVAASFSPAEAQAILDMVQELPETAFPVFYPTRTPIGNIRLGGVIAFTPATAQMYRPPGGGLSAIRSTRVYEESRQRAAIIFHLTVNLIYPSLLH